MQKPYLGTSEWRNYFLFPFFLK